MSYDSNHIPGGIGGDVTSFLFGGGKAFPFDNVNDTVEGEILAASMQQQRAMDTGELLTWADGSPRKQLVITLQTLLRDGPEDDGVRNIYAKGGKHDVAEGIGESMRDAIANAVRQAGCTRLEVGGDLVVAFTGKAPAKRGYQPAKLYTAAYRPPTAGIAGSALFAEQNQQATVPGQVSAAQVAPVAAAFSKGQGSIQPAQNVSDDEPF